MSKNQVEIFESKLLQIINNQNNIYEFINDYINDKSYGTFRIFSKRLKELNIKLFHDNSISEEEYKKIDFVIKNKSKIRNPEVIFNIDAFFCKLLAAGVLISFSPSRRCCHIFCPGDNGAKEGASAAAPPFWRKRQRHSVYCVFTSPS